jgi:hypothetical protein
VVHDAFYKVTMRRGVESKMTGEVDINSMIFKDEGGRGREPGRHRFNGGIEGGGLALCFTSS